MESDIRNIYKQLVNSHYHQTHHIETHPNTQISDTTCTCTKYIHVHVQ